MYTSLNYYVSPYFASCKVFASTLFNFTQLSFLNSILKPTLTPVPDTATDTPTLKSYRPKYPSDRVYNTLS